MRLPDFRPILIVVALVTISIPAYADDEETDAEDEKKHPFAVRFVDEAGKPVSGALAGVTAYFGSEGGTLPADESGWRYWQGAKTDDDGAAQLADGAQLDHLCLVARHTSR